MICLSIREDDFRSNDIGNFPVYLTFDPEKNQI